MDNTDLIKSGQVTLVNVLFHHTGDILGGEGVQINGVF
jgi:hypothetical protein